MKLYLRLITIQDISAAFGTSINEHNIAPKRSVKCHFVFIQNYFSPQTRPSGFGLIDKTT